MSRLIHTERLLLRPLTLADAEPTARLMTPDIARWTGSWKGRNTADDVAERLLRQQSLASRGLSFDRAIVIKEDGALIGWIGVRKTEPGDRRGSLGYWIGEDYFARGYTREAAAAILPYAWDALGLDVIEGVAQLPNAASIAVLRGLGMRYLGDREEYSSARGLADPCAWYEISRPG